MALLRYDLSDDAPDYYDSRPACKDCEYKEERFENAKEFFAEVVKQLYSKEDLDMSTLEMALDEVSHYFDIKLNPNDIMVERFKEVEHV